jgi:hypothetical protein
MLITPNMRPSAEIIVKYPESFPETDHRQFCLLREGNVSKRVGVNILAFLISVRGCALRNSDLVTGVELDIDEENHGDQNGINDDGVNVAHKKVV